MQQGTGTYLLLLFFHSCLLMPRLRHKCERTWNLLHGFGESMDRIIRRTGGLKRQRNNSSGEGGKELCKTLKCCPLPFLAQRFCKMLDCMLAFLSSQFIALEIMFFFQKENKLDSLIGICEDPEFF